MKTTSSLIRLVGLMLGLKSASVLSSSFLLPSISSPCKFDPRCLCSVGAAEYGSVVCDGVPLADVPIELQESRVFQLRLRHNQLYRFPDAKLSGSGMWGLEVSGNPITEIPSMAFYGLERALWELNLSNNQLTRIPTQSVAILKKLSVLVLADNRIAELRAPDLRPLASSLKELDLAGNALTSVPEAIFWDLQRLERVDLSRNNIIQIHSMAFQNGVPLLSHLNLADNLMGKIPFVSIGHIKSLKRLDLSKNRITKVADPFFQGRIHLDTLVLKENNIDTLSANDFQNFEFINFTSLAGNPLRSVETDAFLDTQIKHLDLSNGFVTNLDSEAFKGLEKSLESLDLSGNRLQELSEDLFNDFDSIRILKLDNNMLISVSPNASFNGFRYTIKELKLQGEDMNTVPLDEMGVMRNLRTVGIKSKGDISSDCFDSFSPSLEELDLVSADVTSIDRHAFKNVPSISTLDLSDNRISRIDDDAFKDVGNALQSLKMSNALYFRQLPNTAFHCLTGLVSLDLSNNHISSIPLDTFHNMARLEQLYLQDNEISDFKRGTFHSQANPSLHTLDLSFNHIDRVEMDTFRFPELRHLFLSDNQIRNLDSRSFVEMTQLLELSLEGNWLTSLPDETFQNLHLLRKLNLAYNHLESVNFAAFDSVGTLAHLEVDLSHNWLQALRVNRSQSYPTNIMKLDLSYNNISQIEATFFESVRNDLKILNLSHNTLAEISPDDVGQLRRLYSLDLSHNRLGLIEQTTFMSARNMRSIDLSHNQLDVLDSMLFNSQSRLRFVDLSDNLLASLPEQLFQRTNLEIFEARNNQLKEIPIKALNPVQSTLKYLDLSGNLINTISDSQLSQIQLLVVLNLAHNAISSIDREAFCCVPNLQHLDLSFNPLHRVSPETFQGVEAHLRSLNLANTSLSLLPSLHLSSLTSLNVSHNELTFVPANTLLNLSEVRELDLSHNELPAPPNAAWHSMHHLQSLNLAGNPISRVINESFVGLEHLERLDITGIDLEDMQSGTFGTMPNLRSLRLRLGPDLDSLNLASLLTSNLALESLHLELSAKFYGKGSQGRGRVLRNQLQDQLPKRLSRISIEGEVIENLHPAAFKHLRSRRLELTFKATSRLDLDRDLFLNLGQVQNLSLVISGPHGVDVANFSQHFQGKPRHLGNPVTTYSPNHPRAVFLEHLRISGNSWPCSCDGIGWVEKWLRRWRGAFCSQRSSSEACQATLADLRTASCQQNAAKSVLHEIKYRLECDLFNGAQGLARPWRTLLVLTLSLVFKIKA